MCGVEVISVTDLYMICMTRQHAETCVTLHVGGHHSCYKRNAESFFAPIWSKHTEFVLSLWILISGASSLHSISWNFNPFISPCHINHHVVRILRMTQTRNERRICINIITTPRSHANHRPNHCAPMTVRMREPLVCQTPEANIFLLALSRQSRDIHPYNKSINMKLVICLLALTAALKGGWFM